MAVVDATMVHQIVKAYDIRGRVADQLTPDVMYALGFAAAQVLDDPSGPIALGYDMRESSPALADAFAEGCQDAGRDVLDLGLVSTDMVWFASGAHNIAGAMITASHNPPSDNGVKLCGPNARPVSITSGLATIRDIALQPLTPVRAAARGTRSTTSVHAAFAAHVHAVVGWESPVSLTVVVDAGNGMGGLVWPLMRDAFAISTDELYFTLDGTFPNHPANPLEEANLAALRARVVETGADVGFAFDGDADRVFAVDEQGAPVSASAMGAVLARWLLRQHPGAPVLANAITSRCVERAVDAAGGELIRTRVGHSFIKDVMAKTGAVYACEHSGHHYFRENFGADSGAIAAVMFLRAVADGGVPVSELVAPYRVDASLGEQSFAVTDATVAMDAVVRQFAARGTATELDGVTVTFADGWLNLRPSNTEPVVRLNIEAHDAATVAAWRTEVLDAMTRAGCLPVSEGGNHA